MDWKDRITIDPKIQHGKPVIRGTRTPITCILGGLAGGMSFAELQRAYEVTEDDIRAAIAFAQDLVEQEQYHAMPA
ncbi:MAG: DUF433 domain-containing protein [Phycisphaerae bacterium]|nr:DUF433 domain-containing protein [Phycisphaerae bacterium]